ncbi:LmbE family N-acetylglucosaminyl deacetylase [Keratinibaculum paraultunense]|uniref:LmbE family N-acetylglucosaminyl deacetylase n=1 Tax=Keratinibaculum paraultunense TaxID=1278232 RepID=A0A4R3L4P9_9FIRM|nr:PIG-L family deacetylase [Keratinibaculum paraultunense]QQY80030.1 PIG-L family deacetylase [Keratinibaculum paraultunense]TCS91649.1 LmbE family N-acetylglucosaminyl deacetylase [Keratinibaculum paraultunense]
MVKNLAKLILKHPIKLINNIYTYYYYKNSVANENLKIDDMIGKDEKIMVFSPHVDDETIGIGATLLKHKKESNSMALVYLTDGGGSTSDLSREELVKARRMEGEKIKEIYKFNSIYFLDEIDGKLDSSKEELIDKIINLLSKEEPTIIYTPFLLDGHTDHVETTRAVIRALEKCNNSFDRIYMYEVNCPIDPKIINSISIMDEKLYNEKGNIYNVFSSQWAMDFSVFEMLDRKKRFIVNEGYGAEVFVRANLDTIVEIEKMLYNLGFKPEQFRQLSSRYNLLPSFRTNRELKKNYVCGIKNILNGKFQQNSNLL